MTTFTAIPLSPLIPDCPAILRRSITLCLVAIVAIGLVGCASSQPGSPDVYARINAMTDCVALQHEFDQADENRAISSDPSIQTSYMTAANNRMRELSCYG